MAAYEGSYKSLLQGVSQQVARERQDGQVSAQDNMLSDAVTNLRRRPGMEYKFNLSVPGATLDSIHGWETDIGGFKRKVILNTVDGVVRILATDYTLEQTLPANTYLITANPSDIHVTTVADSFVLCNVSVAPTLGAAAAGITDPAKKGFFYIRAGAFSKDFQIVCTTALGTTTKVYTTPNGTGAGDSALSTGEYIATQLVTALNTATATTGVTWTSLGAYAYGTSTADNVVITSASGTVYVACSGQRYVPQESDLPSRLPTGGDGFIMSVGSLREPTYYQYQLAKSAWLEVGVFGSPDSLQNMPVRIIRNYVSNVWQYDTTPYEGRYAGDSVSNPAPNFIIRGITGMGSFQGRLVLLSGSLVCLSGSKRITRWYRSTVVDLIDSDPIEVGASANSSAAYVYAIPFQKNLLLFSEKYQALIPGGNVAITPRTATVVVTSTYEADITAAPIGLGRTVMFPAPRSADFFGVMEMVPSLYTDSQYVSDDVTSHLPKYMPGKCRFAVSSSVANLILFASDRDKFSLTVHEYLWSNNAKVQSAWHRWVFPYEVSDAFFSGGVINILMVKNGILVGCTIDPRIGTLTLSDGRRPYLDMYTYTAATAFNVPVPAWLRTFDPAVLPTLKLSSLVGGLAGEQVGASYNLITDAFLTTGDSFESGTVALGIPYRSSISPSAPMIKDNNGVVISSNKLTILRYMVGTANSAEYEVLVRDGASAMSDPFEMSTLYWSSTELDLGVARNNIDSVAILPCRTYAPTTTVLMYTDGLGELNLVSLEYVCKYTQKLQRR